MSLSKRFKHRNKVVVAALATTAALGGVGVAAAAGAGPAPAPTTSSNDAGTDQKDGPEQGKGTGTQEGPEQKDGPEQNGASEQQEPALNGSMKTQEVAGENETQEQARLSGQAKVSQAQAERAAVTAVPGTVKSSQLGSENGSLVWEVHVTKDDGSSVEVKVDAGNGKVLAQEAGDQNEASTSGAQEPAEQGETEAGTG